MMQFNMGCRSKKRVRLRAGAVPSVHTAPSSGPGPPVVLRPAGNIMVTDPSEMLLDENVNCAPLWETLRVMKGEMHLQPVLQCLLSLSKRRSLHWPLNHLCFTLAHSVTSDLHNIHQVCSMWVSAFLAYLEYILQTIRMLKLFGLQSISVSTGLILSGDCRSDSPGHCAKYGTYSLTEDRINKILDIQLVQSSEVPSSSWCELEGLKLSIRFLTEQHMQVSVLITDRNRQVAKWVREELCPKGTSHFFDIWHIGKSLGKALDAAAKERECEDLKMWRPAVINHLFWTAASTPTGDADVMEAKWKSMVNHVQDIHEHDTPRFPCCAHPPLEGEARNKEWIKAGSTVTVKLKCVATRTALVNCPHSIRPFHWRHFTPSSCTLHQSTLGSPSLGCTADFSWQPCISTTMAAERLLEPVMVRRSHEENLGEEVVEDDEQVNHGSEEASVNSAAQPKAEASCRTSQFTGVLSNWKHPEHVTMQAICRGVITCCRLT